MAAVVGIKDPVRPGVEAAMHLCFAAGIKQAEGEATIAMSGKIYIYSMLALFYAILAGTCSS